MFLQRIGMTAMAGFSIRKTDQTRIRQELHTLSQDFENKTEGLSVDAKWVLFESAMQNIINNCIPHKLSSSHSNLPWFKRSLRRQVQKKLSKV